MHELPDSIVSDALSEQVPSAFAPFELEASDYAVVRTSGGDRSLHAWIEQGSVRWVRVSGFVVVPRAVLAIEARGVSGNVRHADFTQPFVASDGVLRARVPIALLSSEDPSVHIEVARGDKVERVSYALRFRPRADSGEGRERVAFDTSCSPYGLSVISGSVPEDSWMLVGCRVVRTGRSFGMSATLELYVLWDHAGDVLVDGVPRAPRLPGLFTLRVEASPGRIKLSARGRTIELGYRLPPVLHAGFMGAGVGPYYYAFERPERSVSTVVPLVTLYAGYAIRADTRVVYFAAAALHEVGYADQGLYLWLEQFRIFDERISMNLLLGGNLLVYHRVNRFVARINAPQGVEFIFRDFLGVNKNLTLGAFLYPDINGSAYYNGWMRWGSPRFFGEVNFLDWREPHSTGETKSQSVGVTFGMPLFRFL